jgi:hypothetical protein
MHAFSQDQSQDTGKKAIRPLDIYIINNVTQSLLVPAEPVHVPAQFYGVMEKIFQSKRNHN